MLGKVITAPLDPGIPGLTLANIKEAQRLNELEFYFPLQRIAPDMLRTLLQEHALPGADDCRQPRARRILLYPGAGDAEGVH